MPCAWSRTWRCGWSVAVRDLNRPDAIVIPGSKNVPGDLNYLHESGLARQDRESGPGRRVRGRGHLRRIPDDR